MRIFEKSKEILGYKYIWVGLGLLCLIGWINAPRVENTSTPKVVDIETDTVQTIAVQELTVQASTAQELNVQASNVQASNVQPLEQVPTCPESLSENGPCEANSPSGTDTGGDGGSTEVYLPIIMDQVNVQLPESIEGTTSASTGPADDRSEQKLNSTRLGFGFTRQNSLDSYPELDSLQAGWYVDWQARLDPPRPRGMEYVQMVHVHQKVTCGSRVSSDREACPYVEPHAYEVQPSLQTIAEIAQANPSSIWLVGNEIERLDWGTEEGPGGQDEILPTLYPVAYHDIYTAIKDADPTAQVAIGGVIQPTPLRLQYLTIIWETYQELYGETMPVDIWNTHNFIMPEKRGDWGAEIPVGVSVPSNGEGLYVGDAWKHIDMVSFDQQIRSLRLWMKDRGQQNKPLIVSEYGVVYPNWILDLRPKDQTSIQEFILDTFDYFLNTKDCSIGYAADDCRLVQRWNWYSLDDKTLGFSTYARLYDPDTKEMTEIGEKFRDYSQNNSHDLIY